MSLDLHKTPAIASTELRRLIAAQETQLIRTYRIAVEDLPSVRRRRRVGSTERPPKPPLDGAVLHVRPGNQFVLIRTLPSGEKFVTGSNGRTSWAVRPDGPVRFSTDLTRFNHDLPGHEHGFPLLEIKRGLSQLSQAYDVQLLPIEPAEDRQETPPGVTTNSAESNSAESASQELGSHELATDGSTRNELADPASTSNPPTRLLVAVKKPGHRGPQRVEITYAVPTGQIRQLRFIEMPYGPEHLTVRLTQEEDRPLDDSFFDHQSHHDATRIVEEE
jgi:hypothetical protein